MRKLVLLLIMLFLVSTAYADNGNHYAYGKKKVIIVKGEDGQDGKDGVNGVDGEDGQDGAKGDTGATGSTGKDGEDANKNNEYGVKADAPYLIRFKENWYAGLEAGKDLNKTNSNEGYFVYAKITYVGTLLNLGKD